MLVDGDDLAQRVREVTGTSNVDRALDAVSGEAAGRLFDCVAEEASSRARLLAGDEVIIPSAQLIFEMSECEATHACALRSRCHLRRPALYADLFEGVASSLFHTPVLETFSFEEIHEAVELAERSGRAK